eukprot:CAMPEP_0114125924 /NCGR_PEP_ID=MMETSP0043_2-20121206/9555_1 /TAXON_ID=464988 /ORGANISM="Hemiselmis andersenii, Strain CCMP644" /LENGTH=820 /DNA_ID=CAMNT_0001218873 /DNA_START=274 /DNA_END=2732 /DNA_ORIENTATION=-
MVDGAAPGRPSSSGEGLSSGWMSDKYSKMMKGKRNARKRVEHWLQASDGGYILDSTNTVLSMLSCILYVYETYAKPYYQAGLDVELLRWRVGIDWMDTVDFIFACYFLFHFIVHLYAAESRPHYIMSWTTFVDLLTVIPPLTCYSVLSQPGYVQRLEQQVDEAGAVRATTRLAFLRFVRVFRILRLFRMDRGHDHASSDVSRQIFKVCFTLISIAFIFAGIFYSCESLMVEPALMTDIWGPPLGRYPLRNDTNADGDYEYKLLYHDVFYYTIITISTVGYGDFFPISDWGKVLVSLMLAITFVIISKQTNRLLTLMGMQSVYARHRFRASTRASHVMVCGNIQTQSARDFLTEFFHPDHGQADAKLVILSPHTPDAGMEYILRSAEFGANTIYLEGSAMNETDLVRCCAAECEYVFILANKFCTDPQAEDAATALRAVSIKKHVAQNANGKNIPVMLQLIRPENKHQFTSSVYGRKERSQIICMDEIKLHLLAKSALCPGFSTMVSNLIKSCDAEADDSSPEWLQEYVQGVGQEIYRTKLSPSFRGKTFSEAAKYIYTEFSSTMFAIEVDVLDEPDESSVTSKHSSWRNSNDASVSGKQEGEPKRRTHVLLNPAWYVIGGEDTHVFVLADDQEAADELTTADCNDTDEKSVTRMLGEKAGDLFGHVIGKGGIKHMGRRKSSVGSMEDIPQYELLQTDMNLQQSRRISRLRANYHVLKQPLPLEDATWDTVGDMRGHVLLCGSTSALFYFAATLRSRSTPKSRLKNLVILHPDPPHKAWGQINLFPNIFYVQGSALEPTDLARAGVHGLARAVILSHAKPG